MSSSGPPLAYSAFFARSPDPSCALRFDGRFLALNQAWERALGVPTDDLLDTPLFELIHPDDRERARAAMRALEARANSGSPDNQAEERFESRLRNAAGTYVRLTFRAVPIAKDGLVFASAREVSRARSDMRRWKALADTLPYLVGMASLTDGNVPYVNPAGRLLIGLPREDQEEEKHRQLVTPASLAQYKNEVVPALARGETWSGESEILRKDGVVVPIHKTVVGLRGPAGELTGTALIARDLRDERRMKKELRRFQALADATSDLIATVDLSGAVTYMNPAGMEMLGRAGQDFRGLTIRDMVDLSLKRTFSDTILPAVAKKGIWSGEIELRSTDRAALPVSLVVLALWDEHDEPCGFGAIARDLRGQKALEAALAQAVSDMSTPMLMVSRGVLALPILGHVDEARAAQMTERLLQMIVETRCRVAVLDLTGASEPDAAMMGCLLRMARAAALLGSRCFLSGASPAAAVRVTQADVDVRGVRAFATLKDALRAAVELSVT